MRIAVIGAAGRTGRLIVAKAVGHGHEVTAFTRNAPSAPDNAHVTSVVGDVRDIASVRELVVAHDAVAFALSATTGGPGVHEAGIANVIYAMAESGVSRLAAMSAAGTFDRNNPVMSLAYRALIATTMRGTYDDLEAMERRIMASDLAWTIVRPVGLSDDPPTGHYRISLDGSLLSKTKRIPRGEVASVMVKALETDTYWRRTVVVAR